MPTNKQRREAARRHLERQLERRAERDANHKRFALIASVVGAVVVVAIVVALVIGLGGDDNSSTNSPNGAANSRVPTTSSSPSGSTAVEAAGCTHGSKPVTTATGSGPAVSFKGVTVKNATDLSTPPSVGSTATKAPSKLLVKDLVVGKGTAATPSSTVSVRYTGVLYCDGTEFDGPAEHGDKAVSFPLTGVVPGFTQGIGGTKSIAPMKVGGRRIIVMPAALGYGAQANGAIPANSPLVFVVTLESVS